MFILFEHLYFNSIQSQMLLLEFSFHKDMHACVCTNTHTFTDTHTHHAYSSFKKGSRLKRTEIE